MISNAVPPAAFGLGVQYAMLNGYGIDPAVSTSAIGVTSVWNLMVTLALPARPARPGAVRRGDQRRSWERSCHWWPSA